MTSQSTKTITFTPKAGFVVKTTSIVDGTYKTRLGSTAPASNNSIEPSSASSIIRVAKGHKIFINVCYDPAVPPPPERTEDQVRRAMLGADLDDSGDATSSYYVPVIVSDGKAVVDKAGKASLAFDCVFNYTLKSRAGKDPDFRTFLSELALERVEDKSGLALSREISTPNILSKGTLEPRTVLIPSSLPVQSSKPLIQEIKTDHSLKRPQSNPATSAAQNLEQPLWSAEVEKNGVTVSIQVPKLTKSLLASQTTLDVEAHRILFRVERTYALDLRLSAAGKLVQAGSPMPPPSSKGLEPDSAQAQWKVKDGVLDLKVLWRP